MEEFAVIFETPLDVAGFVLLLIAFPVYQHSLPFLRRRLQRYASGKRLDRWTESWIHRLVEGEQVVMGAQQTRNTTMVASLLASSTLILMGFAASFLVHYASTIEAGSPDDTKRHLVKVFLAFVALAVSFAYFASSLRRLGQFTVLLGADAKLMDRTVGSAVGYLHTIYKQASRNYTLGIRYLYALFPIAIWLFDDVLFVILTAVWFAKFVFVEDFAYLFKRRKRPSDDGTGSIVQRHGF